MTLQFANKVAPESSHTACPIMRSPVFRASRSVRRTRRRCKTLSRNCDAGWQTLCASTRTTTYVAHLSLCTCHVGTLTDGAHLVPCSHVGCSMLISVHMRAGCVLGRRSDPGRDAARGRQKSLIRSHSQIGISSASKCCALDCAAASRSLFFLPESTIAVPLGSCGNECSTELHGRHNAE